MPSSRKSAMIALAVALGATQAVAQQAGDKKEKANKPKEKPRTEAADDGLDLPIPKGKPQKGVNAPMYGADGKLKYNFRIGVATLMEDNVNVRLEQLRVEKFRADGTREIDMDLPDAIYNRQTKVLSSETKAVIRRQDFEVTGNRVAYNLETGEGTLGGGVKMLIYDMGATAKGEEPSIEFQAKPDATPAQPANKQPK
jgi:hypothetical protein